MKILLKWIIWGYPQFQETSISANLHISLHKDESRQARERAFLPQCSRHFGGSKFRCREESH